MTTVVGTEMESISVVIPNFNGASLLEKNLPSVIAALQHAGLRYEIIVADDCSTDESVAFLKEAYPHLKVVRNEANQGFSKNINSGLKIAQGSLVLALNSDVFLDENYFVPLLPYFEAPDTFGVMGALCNPNNKQVEDAAKCCELTGCGQIRSTRNLLPKDGSHLSTFFLSGANALMDRQKLERIGFFNELFSPFYNEDVDLGLRAWRMGWKCFFEPKSKAYHSVSQTIQKHWSKKTVREVSLRNRFFLHDIHLVGLKRVLFFSKVSFEILFRWLFWDWAFYRAAWFFLAHRDASSRCRAQFEELQPKMSFLEVYDSLRKEQAQKTCEIF